MLSECSAHVGWRETGGRLEQTSRRAVIQPEEIFIEPTTAAAVGRTAQVGLFYSDIVVSLHRGSHLAGSSTQALDSTSSRLKHFDSTVLDSTVLDSNACRPARVLAEDAVSGLLPPWFQCS